jgi:AraC-like DNA-binding protein/quercetin dioxygenase-like cupin family protein
MLQKNHTNELYEKIPHGTSNFPYKLHLTELDSGFSLYPHLHQEFELLVMHRGDGIMYTDNVEYVLSEGDGLFINSKSIHFGKKLHTKTISFYAIVFSEKIIGSAYHDLIYEKYVTPVINNDIRLPTYLPRTGSWQSRILDIADELYASRDSSAWCEELRIKTKLLKLWTLLCEQGSPSQIGFSDKHLADIKSVMEYITDNYASRITLSDLARHCHMSSGHFSRVFSSIMHKSPYQYLMDTRIEKSSHLLSTSTLPVGEIAVSCGFCDFSYYSKIFKEAMGYTPSEYRRLHRCR